MKRVCLIRDFFAKSKLNGCDWLYDVERIGEGMIGVVLIEPPGIEMTYVFDVAGGRKILSSAAIHEKDERAARMGASIRVSDAVRLARLAMEKKAAPLQLQQRRRKNGNLRLRKSIQHGTKRRQAIARHAES